jgi:hypothetical protein
MKKCPLCEEEMKGDFCHSCDVSIWFLYEFSESEKEDRAPFLSLGLDELFCSKITEYKMVSREELIRLYKMRFFK